MIPKSLGMWVIEPKMVVIGTKWRGNTVNGWFSDRQPYVIFARKGDSRLFWPFTPPEPLPLPGTNAEWQAAWEWYESPNGLLLHLVGKPFTVNCENMRPPSVWRDTARPTRRIIVSPFLAYTEIPVITLKTVKMPESK